jgi:beta-fructofuranosidase
LYWYVSDNITGPFNPVNDLPIVSGSETIGQYGINFLPAPDNPEELIPYGWYPKLFRIEVSPSLCRARWNDNSIKIG